MRSGAGRWRSLRSVVTVNARRLLTPRIPACCISRATRFLLTHWPSGGGLVLSRGEPGRRLYQDVALLLDLPQLPAQPHKLVAFGRGQAFLAGSGLPSSMASCATQFLMVCAEQPKCAASSMGLRPARTNSMIC